MQVSRLGLTFIAALVALPLLRARQRNVMNGSIWSQRVPSCLSLVLLVMLLSISGCSGSRTPDGDDAAEQVQSWLDREFPEQFRVERVDASNSRTTDVHGRPAYAFDGIVYVRLLVDQKVTAFERIAQPWLGELEGTSGETKQTRPMVFTWVKEGNGWKWSHFASAVTNEDLFGTPRPAEKTVVQGVTFLNASRYRQMKGGPTFEEVTTYGLKYRWSAGDTIEVLGAGQKTPTTFYLRYRANGSTAPETLDVTKCEDAAWGLCGD